MEPEQWGPYRLDALLGSGAAGEVYRAYDTRRERVVALRILRDVTGDNVGYQERVRSESRMVARLPDPHVIPIHDVGELDGKLYIDMRLVDGRDVATVLAEEGRLAPERAVGLIDQVAQALDAAHASGLVHRDITPSNVLVTPSDFVYVVDFGLAPSANDMDAGRSVNSTGVVVGSLDYMAPERFFDGRSDHSVDVYALACLLYESLTGQKPFPGAGPELMFAHFYAKPPRPSDVDPRIPAGLDEVVARGLSKRPEARYASAGQLAKAARDALNGPRDAPPAVHPAGSSEPSSMGMAPRPAPAAPSEQPPPPAGATGAFPVPPTCAPQSWQPDPMAPRTGVDRRRRPWFRRRWPRTAPAERGVTAPGNEIGEERHHRDGERRVVIAIIDARGAAPVGPLVPETRYLLRVTVGAELVGNVMRSAPPFPTSLLPAPQGFGWWLTITAHSDDVDLAPGPHPLFLPDEGPAWGCACRPGGHHACRPQDRWAAVDLPFVAGRPDAVTPFIATAVITVCTGATQIQAFEVTVPIGDVGGALRPGAVLVYTLSAAIDDITERRPRDLSVLSEGGQGGGHRLHVNGVPGPPVVFEMAEAAAAEAARHLRSLLFDSHLVRQGAGWTSRYGAQHATDRSTYREDLRRLAVAGSELYLGLFKGEGSDVQRRLREVGRETGRPAELQIARAVNARLAVPWQLVYDEPIDDGHPPSECPSVAEYGPGSTESAVPPTCPHVDSHDGNTLCPFGFWGLAHHVECPPSMFTRRLPEATGDQTPPDLTVALHPDLATAAWGDHDRVLRSLGGRSPVQDVDALRASVVMGTDVLYFYCHGARVERSGSSAARPILDLGRGGQLSPLTLNTWGRGEPRVRWERRRPLVVLNGCHTGEVLPEIPAELLSAFVDGLGAAGVIATEVAVEATLAATAMELFLRALFKGEPVGAAMRGMRWALLARGNVLGLGYAAYCDNRLRLPGPAVQGGAA